MISVNKTIECSLIWAHLLEQMFFWMSPLRVVNNTADCVIIATVGGNQRRLLENDHNWGLMKCTLTGWALDHSAEILEYPPPLNMITALHFFLQLLIFPSIWCNLYFYMIFFHGLCWSCAFSLNQFVFSQQTIEANINKAQNTNKEKTKITVVRWNWISSYANEIYWMNTNVMPFGPSLCKSRLKVDYKDS